MKIKQNRKIDCKDQPINVALKLVYKEVPKALMPSLSSKWDHASFQEGLTCFGVRHSLITGRSALLPLDNSGVSLA